MNSYTSALDRLKSNWLFINVPMMRVVGEEGLRNVRDCVRFPRDTGPRARSSTSRRDWWRSIQTAITSTQTPSGSRTAVSVRSNSFEPFFYILFILVTRQLSCTNV